MNKITTDVKKVIGQRINELLATNNVKQKELAAYLSIPDNTISYFAKGTRVPNTEQIIKIAGYFNVSTDYLLGKTDVRTTDTELKNVAEYMGLSEDVIEKFARRNKWRKSFYEEQGHTDILYLYDVFMDRFFGEDMFSIVEDAIIHAFLKALFISAFPDIDLDKVRPYIQSHYVRGMNNIPKENTQHEIISTYFNVQQQLNLCTLDIDREFSEIICLCADEIVKRGIDVDKYKNMRGYDFNKLYNIYSREHMCEGGEDINGEHTGEKK